MVFEVGTGLSIARSGDKITFTNTDTGSGSNNTFIGLTDTPSSYTANKTLKVNSAGNAVIFADDINTTYDLITSSSGSNVQLLLDASSGDDDPILITAGSNVSFADVTSTGFTINTQNDNTQLTTEEVQDIVGAMFSGNTETRISATYQDSDGTIDLIVDDQSADNNTTYDLTVPSGTTKIRLEGSDSTNDDITITGGSNITVSRTSATELNIGTNSSIVATNLLNLSRIQFGPGSSNNDDANFEWLGGDNDGYLRISVSDDSDSSGTSDEYIELGDYAIGGSSGANLSSTFTQWAKLARDELTMESAVRIKGALKDKDGDTGTNGQVLVSTGSQVNWVPSSSVGTDTQLTTEKVQDIVGAMFSGNTETRISATYQDSDGTIDLVVDDMNDNDTNTTYSISCVDGLNTDEERIRLTGTNPSSTDDITLEAGTGLSIARSGDKITFTNTVADDDTTYLLKAQQVSGSNNNPNLLLDASSGTDDTVRLAVSYTHLTLPTTPYV